MSFNRPPRIQKALPSETVKIPVPRGMPSKPGEQSWLTTLLPIGMLLISVVIIILVSGGGASLSYLIFLPLMLASYAVTIISGRNQRKAYTQRVAEVKERYTHELRQVGEKLKTLKHANEKTLRDQSPSVLHLVERAKTQDTRLGERRPHDADFLSVRLGAGNSAASYTIEPVPEDLESEELAEEIRHAKGLPAAYQTLQNVAVSVNLAETGSIGFSGRSQDVTPVVRSFLSNLLVHNWPTEVQISIAGNSSKWAWVDNTPHSAVNLISGGSVNEYLNNLESLLHSRDHLVESRRAVQKDGEENSMPLPIVIVLLDAYDGKLQHPAISVLLDKGKKLGVIGLFVTETSKQVPSKCGAVVEIVSSNLTLKLTGHGGVVKKGVVEKMALEDAQRLSAYLERINWPDDLSTSPPELITLLDLLGSPEIEDLPVRKWWEENPKKDYLSTPIGLVSPTSPFVFDINDSDSAYGPHGVLGGMTGSGKSEVLKTILLALAVKHHPYDMNFALIDFKGGSAFSELEKLPHTVGVITNIESHSSYAERIILALSGEIETREKILGQAMQLFGLRRAHIDDYRLLRVKKPLPRLIIVFDEFAEFKQKHPDESKRLISIARKGRSLGIHLILATQNIPSAVDPEVLQNSSFRICLRVSEAQDSMQLVGVPDAVNLPRGRAIILGKTRTQFQVAYAGAEYGANHNQAGKEYVRVWPDGRKDVVQIEVNPQEDRSTRQTQTTVIVDKIIQTAIEMNLAPPPKVWPEPLDDQISLDEILEKTLVGGWDGTTWQPVRLEQKKAEHEVPVSPILGMYDVPAKQKQYIYQLNQGMGGDHLLVFGSAGTGRSTLLRTLVISGALLNAPSAVSFYIIDYGGQSSLNNLQELPHVGAVATRNEREKTERIIQYLHAETNRRNELLSEKRKANWREYNRAVAEEDKLPVIYLVIDNFREFKTAFEQNYSDDLVSSLDALLSGSTAIGIFLVASSNTLADLSPTKFADNISQRISLYQVDEAEYSNIIGRPSKSKLEEEINLGPVPGRGYLRATPPLEFQAAHPLYEGETLRGERFADIVRNMATWKGHRPQKIDKLPLLIPYTLSEKSAELGNLSTPLGREYSTFKELGFSLAEDGPFFWIASQSNAQGKTSLIKGWVLSLAKLYSSAKLRINFIDFHGRREYANLAEIPHTDAYVAVGKQFADVLTNLTTVRQERQMELDALYEKDPKADGAKLAQSWPHILVVLDDFGKLMKAADAGELATLGALSQNARELGISFLIGARTNDFPRYEAEKANPFGAPVRAHGTGVLLGGTEGLDEFNQTLKPKGQPNVSGLPPGRGFLVNRNQAQLMHAFAYWNEGESIAAAEAAWVKQINKK
ncbi:MAG: hypothetical protein KIS88_00525 [Anaerolineales bacterium]|nr:hypothetical protein [Anaerolineales bacterium]